MLCLKKRRTYSFTQGACNDIPRRSTKEKNGYNETLNMAVTTLPRKHRSREEQSSGGMVLTVTEDTPADMLAGSMELLVQLPRDHNVHTQRVTVPRSTPMMDLLVQIATAHKLSASSYTLQAIGERGLVLPHQPNTPIGALDALQVKLLPKQGTFVPRKAKQANQPFETTFRLQVLLPRNQLYVSRVSPKMNLGKILDEVCREKNLDKNKYELRHPANLEETLDLSLSLQDYHLQEVTLYAKQGRNLGAALSSQDIMALQRQEERRRQQAKQSVFGFMFRKSKESTLSIDSIGGRSVSPARSDETGRSVSPLAPPSRPQRKRRPAPKPPVNKSVCDENDDESKEKLVISHSRNSSDSSGYHEASVLSDNPDSSARMPETLPRRSKPPCKIETSRKLAQTSQASKSLGNLAVASGGLSHGISSTSISSTGIRKKRAAPPPPIARPLSSAISSQALERIVDSEESLTSDIDISKSPSDIAASSKANSDIGVSSKANSDIGVHSMGSKPSSEIGYKIEAEFRAALADHEDEIVEVERRSAPVPPSARSKESLDVGVSIAKPESSIALSLDDRESVETPRIAKRETRALAPTPKPRSAVRASETPLPVAPRRKVLESNDSTRSDPAEALSTNDIGIHLKNDESKIITKEDPELRGVVELREINSMLLDGEINLENRVLKHVKSMDDIYGAAMKFTNPEFDQDSLSEGSSCAVISTIPKCAHLTPSIDGKVKPEEEKNASTKLNFAEATNLSKDDPGLPRKNLLKAKRSKIFRSQSALNDFDVNPCEKQARYLTSHPEDFTYALNPNFSQSVANLEAVETSNESVEWELGRENKNSELKKNIVQDFPAFVVGATNLGCREDFTVVENEDNWDPQLIEQSASGDRPTETDILLQKVSDTLSNSLPISAPPLPVEIEATVPREKISKEDPNTEKDESDGTRETLEIPVKTSVTGSTMENKTKNVESVLSVRSNVASSPDATLNSQQDTSDYVSATGDDISITDWEYQLPAPPSAFRDNISPDFDGYDTITLRSVEAFKEPVAESPEEEKIVDLPSSSESPIPPPSVSKEITRVAKSIVPAETEIDRSRDTERSLQREKPKFSSQISSESRNGDVSSELKREIISELATKIENGSLPQSSGKISEQDTRRTTVEFAAPKIAPVDNTLSNFTITTYSRQKSLNIFEEEANDEKRSFQKFTNSENKAQTFANLATSKASIESFKGNFGSKNALNTVEDDLSSEGKLLITRAQSEERIIRPEMEFKKPETKSRFFAQHGSLLRHPSLSNGQEKLTNVQRSKSHITLVNNSKYREDANGERCEPSWRNESNADGRMIKSTSVTNLNQEAPRNNEKFSQWRENILKKQEEPSKEKQLQSLQVLKNILPRLKSTQQMEENVVDSSNQREHSSHTRSNTLPDVESIESKSSVPETRIEPEAKPQKTTEDPTTKLYKYTGPPAISLGSWSERPRVNVQIKMDTDYKFGTSNNNNNISGGKTVVNLNGRSIENNEDKQQKPKTLPRNFSKCLTSNEIIDNRETRLERRESEEELAKKLITHTTATGFKKPTLNRIVFSEVRKVSQNDDAKPIVTSVALKKTCIEKSNAIVDDREGKDADEDDVKIDTKSVNFKELTKTFGEEVCLRAKPKRAQQNRHSDYYGTRPDIMQKLSSTINGQTSFWEIANGNASRQAADSTRNIASNGVQSANNPTSNRRYTSIVGIQPQSNNNYGPENVELIAKSYTTNARTNGPMPVVKGFKIQAGQKEAKFVNPSVQRNGHSMLDSSKTIPNVPPPPTMPIITGVTLKNTTARSKSTPVCSADPRDQLLESIRSFGGRDGLKNALS